MTEKTKRNLFLLLSVFTGLAALLAMLAPAIRNNYPLLFSDSGTYLASGFGNEIPVDRPILYGLFVRLTSLGHSAWLVILAQSLLIMPLFPMLFRRIPGLNYPIITGLSALLMLGLLTDMPLFSSQIMADIFAGAMVIAFLLLKEASDLSLKGKIYLSLLIIFSAGTHLSHMGLLFGLVLVSFLLDLFYLRREGFKWRHQAWAAGTAIGAWLLLSGVNSLYGEGFQLSRTRNTVMVSSLIDKGILREYFQRHPEPEASGLYLAAGRLPENGWQFLWNDDSPLYDSISENLNWVGCWENREQEFGQLVSKVMDDDSSRHLFMQVTGRMIADQMRRFDMGILVPLDSHSVVFPTILSLYPADMHYYTGSRQWHETQSFEQRNTLQRFVVYAALVIILLSLIWIKKLSPSLQRAIPIIAAAYLGNAVLVATLSTVDERYQARIAWLIPLLAMMLVAGRWSVVGSRWSVVGGRWSVVGSRWSVVGGPWSVVGGPWSVVLGRWSLVGGRQAGDGERKRNEKGQQQPENEEPTTDQRPPTTDHRNSALLRRSYLVPASIGLIMVVVVWMQFNMGRWKQRNVIIWDVIEYYSYLPATLYGDFTLRDSVLNKDFNYHAWALDGPKGEKVIKMSSGTSLFFAPAFGLALISDLISGNEVNTFAPKYHMAISLSAALFLWLGLLVLNKVLSRYFSPLSRAITLLILALGTNLLHYSTAEPGMSHVYGFFLFALFMLLVQRWYDSPGWKNSLLLGLVLGWIVLVRPTNGIIGIVFLMYGFPGNLRLLLRKWPLLLMAGAVVPLVFSLQMFYWKEVTGNWLYFSYADEGFFFGNPRIIEGLFSFRKGWLIYTPLVLPALAGLFLKRMPKEWRKGLPVFLVLNIYIVLSWWCWWYGGSYGLRAFIESYALLALPLAAMIETIKGWKPLWRWGLSSVLLLLLSLSLFQSYQYKKTLIHWDSMSWRAYKGVFLKLKFPADYASWLEPPDYEGAKNGHER
jgi:hypothetical protein